MCSSNYCCVPLLSNMLQQAMWTSSSSKQLNYKPHAFHSVNRVTACNHIEALFQRVGTPCH